MKNNVLLEESSAYKMEAVITDEDERLEQEKFRAERQVQPTYPKEITVKFRCERDANDFCCLVQQNLNYENKSFIYKSVDPNNTKKYCFSGIAPQRRETNRSQVWQDYWTDMPSFEQKESKWTFHSIKVICETRDDYIDLAHTLRQYLSLATKTIYHPSWVAADLKQYVWKSTLPAEDINPRYPVFIISKGRAFSRYTSKALEAINVPYYVVVEPAEYEAYASVIDPEKVLTLPYNSDPANPTGPGRARNWCWDYAKQILKTKRHWVMDDNIEAFYRLQKNRRIRVADGAMFRAMEDFVDRFENVRVAGPQYRFFAAPKEELPAYVANTRIYSCLLIDNDGKHRWRERYNEDTILALDVLTDGDCTIQFNAFLQGKMPTQVLKGGNTEVFYHAEGEDFDENNYNATGTVRKSLNLKKIYPQYTVVKELYGRVHHWVDYSSFKSNELKMKAHFETPENSEYGMVLVNRYKD